MDETTLILIRHGATEWNLRRPYVLQGRSLDAPLAELGLAQAQALANDLVEYKIDVVVTSPLKRAVSTAEMVAKAHGLDPQTEPEITEADIGKWEGRTWEEIQEHWADEAAAFERDASVHGYLGGENLTHVRDRAVPALERWADRYAGKTIAVVAHNVVNRSCLGHWLRIPLHHARRLPQLNGGYNVIVWRKGRVSVRSINVSHHLLGLIPTD